MRFSIETYCIKLGSTIKDAMESIDKNLTGGAFVVDQDFHVKGVITDGNIRRALLAGHNINDNIEGVYSKEFKFANVFDSKKKIKELMLKSKIRQVPVLDEEGKIINLYFIDDLISYEEKDNYVFILAGGLGTRLRPLTNNIPKPMLKIGEKPILEHIIEQFKEYGFKNFILSINYKGEIIEDYFKDGKQFDVNIEYVRETKKLGTAGSIKLAEDKLNKPFIVINGDILTGIDFDAFLNYHIENNFDITVGARNYEIKVPYGVMVTDDLLIKSLEEKPVYSFHINSGVYVLNEKVVKYIPEDEMYNMTDLIEDVIAQNGRSGVYQITEYWSDIGQMDDFKKANEDIEKFF
ncbi:D-glycero-alpha-D-manno-heptose 1-phosphate guanylyltransferase [Clostridium homopropionicum DSM 5847]|uniref:D-glycero-alpha-D-manno-heptose 1-phosphate guanylyltransferase n=1 Tax=Clostridium homopropionicum DSM 5847 TaxID=1121318 RepID=A0A0L6ZDR6_9CLOT|nr:nucleotidyltransferase family protein [Clostridium homopropionicum]KOA21124.1 D-glycero-alpha-D-manno-heptose 1-phosphate guanylyltransferase [Clostridium homopropionicum DSM 5847]SFF96652.1 CBS domain-containing protein [Clostridium homopropionicum]